jgi:hypothetical protein
MPLEQFYTFYFLAKLFFKSIVSQSIAEGMENMGKSCWPLIQTHCRDVKCENWMVMLPGN